MMREILFTGKRADNGEWVEGNYYESLVSGCFILVPKIKSRKNGTVIGDGFDVYEVIPETVRQYTGLNDKNGTKIFEGNILKATVIYNDIYRDSTRKVTKVYEVKYHEMFCYFYLARRKDNRLFDGNWNYGVTRLEVIGNIHDNPELLKEMG